MGLVKCDKCQSFALQADTENHRVASSASSNSCVKIILYF
jgi:hypothetical protein